MAVEMAIGNAITASHRFIERSEALRRAMLAEERSVLDSVMGDSKPNGKP